MFVRKEGIIFVFELLYVLVYVFNMVDEVEEEIIIVVNLLGCGDKDLVYVINILGDDL